MINHFNKNEAEFSGTMLGDFRFCYQVFGRDYFSETLEVKRLSNTSDYLTIVFAQEMVTSKLIERGTFVQIKGQIRNYRQYGEKCKTRMVIFVTEIQEIKEPGSINRVELEAYVCKEPIFRVTPNGKKIAETIVAVNRTYTKSDYIYVIAWEGCAKYISKLQVGAHVLVAGRLQSRSYQKAMANGENEQRTTQEISVYKITEI